MKQKTTSFSSLSRMTPENWVRYRFHNEIKILDTIFCQHKKCDLFMKISINFDIENDNTHFLYI